jgi:hypothetical protein
LRVIRSLLSAAALAAIVVTTASAARAADFISGVQLAHACASRAPVDSGSCDGFIAGALDEVVGNAELRSTICPPAGTKLSVLREALGRYGEQHANDTHGSGVALLHAMLKANYPCPAK